MKNMRKLFALVLALVMVMSLATTAFAANQTIDSGKGGPATIKVTLPASTNLEGTETANNTYKIYKVFDATTDGNVISYTLVDGKTTAPAGFIVSPQGNVSYDGTGTELTAADIAAIAAYVTDADMVAEVTTQKGETEFTVTGLPYGYYYITTTTGTAVTVNSTKPHAEVEDKNVVPVVDKKITGASSIDDDGKKALAQIGTDVEYTGTVTVGYGVENYVYHDTLGAGLTFKSESLAVKVGGATVEAAGHYTLAVSDQTFTVSFDNTYIAGLEKDTVIEIVYLATINTNALTEDPEKNTAYLTYGHTPDEDRTPVVNTEVYNAKFTVTKTDDKDEPLAGAGFVLKNAENKYYKYDADNKVVEWVDDVADADKNFSDAEGNVAPFIGLADGTYTLIENTVPAGYNKAADYSFTIAAHDYTAENLEQETEVVNKAGAVLPTTGGMGTTLFYVLGGLMVLAATVLLVTKKRMTAE